MNDFISIREFAEFTISLGIFGSLVFLYARQKFVPKLIIQRQLKKVSLIFDSIYQSIEAADYDSIEENRKVVYFFSGEMNHTAYKVYIEVLRDFLLKVHNLENKLNRTNLIKIVFFGGPRLLVKKRKSTIEKLHPTIDLFRDPIFNKYLSFYFVAKRIPYHALYSPLSKIGLAERPHYELNPPLSWTFDNKEQYYSCFTSLAERIKQNYLAGELRLKEDGNVCIDQLVLNDQFSIDKYFIKKGFWSRLMTIWNFRATSQIVDFKEAMNLSFSAWRPEVPNIFSPDDIANLSPFSH
jgi:hypothetical protein